MKSSIKRTLFFVLILVSNFSFAQWHFAYTIVGNDCGFLNNMQHSSNYATLNECKANASKVHRSIHNSTCRYIVSNYENNCGCTGRDITTASEIKRTPNTGTIGGAPNTTLTYYDRKAVIQEPLEEKSISSDEEISKSLENVIDVTVNTFVNGIRQATVNNEEAKRNINEEINTINVELNNNQKATERNLNDMNDLREFMTTGNSYPLSYPNPSKVAGATSTSALSGGLKNAKQSEEVFKNCNFNSSDWKKFTKDERIHQLQLLENNLAGLQGRDTARISPFIADVGSDPNLPQVRILVVTDNAQKSPDDGRFNSYNNRIEINGEVIMTKDVYYVVETLAEESYHAYQKAEIDKYNAGKKINGNVNVLVSWEQSLIEWVNKQDSYYKAMNSYKKRDKSKDQSAANKKLKEKYDVWNNWYKNLAHEKSAKQFALNIKNESIKKFK